MIRVLCFAVVMICAGVMTGCNDQERESFARHLRSTTLVDESLELSGDEYRYWNVNPDRAYTLSLEIEVESGDAVHVDLLDAADFEAWESQRGRGNYEHHTTFHGEKILRKTFSAEVEAGRRYVVTVRPSKGDVAVSTRFAVKLVRIEKD